MTGLIFKGLLDTLYMVILSTLFAYLLGLPMGVLLSVTSRGGIMENRIFNTIFGWVINILRSIPFIILIVALLPFTKAIVGTVIGPNAAIVALVIAAGPFVARLVEGSLAELDTGVIEAAKCMGATNSQIIFGVMLKESIPSLVRGISITAITLIGYSAMAGSIGAGGLGDIAVRYGYHKYDPKTMLSTVVLLIIIVCIIQVLFDLFSKLLDKRNR